MNDKLKKYPLLLLAAALTAVSFASCSGSEDKAPGASVTSAKTEQTTAVTVTTVPETEKPAGTTAAKETEKTTKATNTTKKTKKKKKKKTSTETTTSVTAADAPKNDAEVSHSRRKSGNAIENLFDTKTNFFSDTVIDMLGKDKDTVLGSFSYDEDFMIVNEPAEKDGPVTIMYVVSSENRYSFFLEFVEDRLVKFSCNTKIESFDSALSVAKAKGWKKDESKVEKGKRSYIVSGDIEYTIIKTREKDGIAYMTQSYELHTQES